MNRLLCTKLVWRLAICAVCLSIPIVAFSQELDEPAGLGLTALDRYVRTPDPHYEYELVNTVQGDDHTVYIIRMVSQKFLTEAEVNQPIWWHWLTMVKPNTVLSDKGLLYIGGGDNDDDPPDGMSERFVRMAVATNSVIAELRMVPNQPLIFVGDETIERQEDESIAYTWDKYLRTGDEKWPLRLPMTKSAVRAMDTMTDFMGSDTAGNIALDHFVVAGGSKRGWTTWTTAAVDDRVVAIMPIVIDMLNVVPSFIHHFEVYGRYAPAVGDYEEMGIMNWPGTEEYAALMDLVEPFSYRDRLTLPKYIINSTGDQFFLPDSSQFYFDELVGPKYLRYVPNTAHSLSGSDVVESMLAWYHAILYAVPLPRFNWNIEEDGTIHVFSLTEPSEVRLWQATNPEARLFMKDVIGEAYTSTVIDPIEPGTYRARAPEPEEGWTAYFVEMTYPSGVKGVPFKFTTDVKVTPDKKLYEYKAPKKKDREQEPEHP